MNQHNSGANSRREHWYRRRSEMEASGKRYTRDGEKPYRTLLNTVRPSLHALLNSTGIGQWGQRNALDIRIRRLGFSFANLPAAFDGFTILHMSDLHLDNLEGTSAAAQARLAGVEVDLCTLTGDFQGRCYHDPERVAEPMAGILASYHARHGTYAVLGNHDSARVVPLFEARGVRFLINESVTLRQGAERMLITGTDDVCAFYTERAAEALAVRGGDFAVALVHSPEMADVAAANGYDLYLTGHTHGGQVCLPGGRPLLTFLDRFREFAVGEWRHGAMTGYTTTGVGVARLPIRFNCPGEITLISLHRDVVLAAPARSS